MSQKAALGVCTLLLLTTLFIAGPTQAAAELHLEIAQHKVKLGRILHARLIYRGKEDHGRADLSAWDDDFYVERRDFTVDRQAEQVTAIESLRLFPRREGLLTLGPIAHGGTVLPATRIEVVPATRKGHTLAPVWLPTPTTVRVGEPFEITVRVPRTPGNEQLHIESWEAPALVIRSLTSKVEETSRGDAVLLRWSVIPLAAGNLHLTPPTITVRGAGRWIFHLPYRDIHAMPLPAYLPPTLVIGHLQISSRLEHDPTGQPYWSVEASSNGLLTEDSYGIRTALMHVAGRAAEQVTFVEHRIDAQSGDSSVRWHVPVPNWSLGAGPQLQLRYYDPQQARLKTLGHRLPSVWQFPQWAWLTLTLALAAVFAGLLHFVRRLSCQVANHRQFRNAIMQATEAHSLRRLLLENSAVTTLEEWALKQDDRRAQTISQQLNRRCFASPAAMPMDAIKQQLLSVTSLFNQSRTLIHRYLAEIYCNFHSDLP